MPNIQLPKFLKWLTVGILSCVCVVAVVACSAPLQPNGSTPGTLNVATAPPFPPFVFKAEDGSLQGFDIDLINAIATTQNLQVEYEEVPFFDDLIRQLYAGSADAAIAGITITLERQEVVSFSRPYFKAGLAIAVQDANTDITSEASLAGKRIGAASGTTGARKARSIPGAQVIGYDSAPLALSDLAGGKVDAVINDEPATRYAIRAGLVRGIKVVGPPLTEEYYGIATPQNSPNLEVINAGLKAVIENGQYAEIYRKWFDQEPPLLPEAATTVGHWPALSGVRA